MILENLIELKLLNLKNFNLRQNNYNEYRF